jgi:hypothetical protein
VRRLLGRGAAHNWENRIGRDVLIFEVGDRA